ncbi:MAG TPA: hypothetical protein PKK40_00245 [Marmoricola sp.]|nr:hypothetical protein [Marmoricola sp.]
MLVVEQPPEAAYDETAGPRGFVVRSLRSLVLLSGVEGLSHRRLLVVEQPLEAAYDETTGPRGFVVRSLRSLVLLSGVEGLSHRCLLVVELPAYDETTASTRPSPSCR